MDSFRLLAGGSLTGTLDGGLAPARQGNWLDYSGLTSAVTVNLQAGAATGVAGGAAGKVAHIQNVHGGNGGNTLTGNSQGNILIGGTGSDKLIGGSGRSILIGDAGSDTVTGGSGSDILIAGTTSYDQDPTALAAILNLWANTSNSYAARVAAVMSSSFQYHLDTTTVFHHSGAPDRLTGGPGLSLFFAHIGGTTGDTTNARTGETVVQI